MNVHDIVCLCVCRPMMQPDLQAQYETIGVNCLQLNRWSLYELESKFAIGIYAFVPLQLVVRRTAVARTHPRPQHPNTTPQLNTTTSATVADAQKKTPLIIQHTTLSQYLVPGKGVRGYR